MSCGLVARFKTQVFLLWLQVSDMFVLTHKTYNCCLPGHWCSFSQMSALPESNVLSYKMETHACLMKASGQNPHWGPCCQIEHTTHWCNIQHIWVPLDMSDLSVTVVTMVSKKNDLNRKRSWLGVTTQLPSQLQTDLDASDLSVTNVTMISKSWKKQLKKQLPLPYDINPNCSWRLTPAVNVAPNVTFNASDCLRDAFKKHTGPGQHPCLQKGSHSFIYAK